MFVIWLRVGLPFFYQQESYSIIHMVIAQMRFQSLFDGRRKDVQVNVSIAHWALDKSLSDVKVAVEQVE